MDIQLFALFKNTLVKERWDLDSIIQESEILLKKNKFNNILH